MNPTYAKQQKDFLEIIKAYRNAKTKKEKDSFFLKLLDATGGIRQSMVNSFYIQSYTTDDLQSVLQMRTIDAINTYDESKGEFAPYLFGTFRRYLINILVAAGRDKYKTLDSSVSFSGSPAGNSSVSFASLLQAENKPPIDGLIAQEELNNLNRVLTDLERQVLEKILEGLSYQETADALGTNEKSVDNAMTRIKAKAIGEGFCQAKEFKERKEHFANVKDRAAQMLEEGQSSKEVALLLRLPLVVTAHLRWKLRKEKGLARKNKKKGKE